jgi:hypothetical protein
LQIIVTSLKKMWQGKKSYLCPSSSLRFRE